MANSIPVNNRFIQNTYVLYDPGMKQQNRRKLRKKEEKFKKQNKNKIKKNLPAIGFVFALLGSVNLLLKRVEL